MTTKPGRGGKRKGAGRPRGRTAGRLVERTIGLRPEQARAIDEWIARENFSSFSEGFRELLDSDDLSLIFPLDKIKG